MAKVKKYINKINDKEERTMFAVVGKAGMISYDQLRELDIPKRRVSNFVSDGYLEKHTEIIEIDDEKLKRTYYTINSEGKKYLKQQGICSHMQKSQSYVHDTAAAQKVIDYIQKGGDPSCLKNEAEQRTIWKNAIDSAEQQKIRYSVTDLIELKTEIINGVEIKMVNVFEVVTESYFRSSTKLKDKERYVSQVLGRQADTTMQSYQLIAADAYSRRRLNQ